MNENIRVVYMSLTGQVQRYVKKLGFPALRINEQNCMTEVNSKYILVVPTYEVEATDFVYDFLETGNNRDNCLGVCGSGNLNFDELYCFTAKDISRDFGVPILRLFEFQGNEEDVKVVQDYLKKVEGK